MPKKEGQKLAIQIIKKCDVLVENFRAGNLKQYGHDYESVKKINPNIAIMQCTSVYPCPYEISNIGVIPEYIKKFKTKKV